ncbi:MAG: HEAT repeat domain-containing protein [Planctomycetes bacterium]|nr:HEAT repeat domain-containing protein [Planctomycetota bacterium]
MKSKFRCVSLIFLVIANTAFAQQDENKQDALQSIERTRGGRHWIDAKTDPPKLPEASRACFQIEPGLQIELVAAEPLVMDPVAIAFDQRGMMFVVEYGDYPTGPEKEGAPPLSRVVLLEDTDDDGRMDRRHVFADRLTFAHSLMPYKEGLIVGAQTEILFLKDTDGDHKADVREVLFSGFTPAHPQMQIGNPRWGLDNWIYLNYGPGKITSMGKTAQPFAMPRSEFRFHPLSMECGPASGLGQFGNTIDNWGNRFFCTNRNPIMTIAMSYEQSRRNPFAVIPKSYYDVGASGGDTRVYPLVEMKSNYLSHAGTHTSACGTTAYHGDLLGPAFNDSVFVCEPIGHLVTRSIIRSDGATLTADRARAKADFLASSDTWFRPASLATGPDGALYLADMYRLWVEHPKFLPEEIAKRIDWRAGEDRGRIWRIVPEDTEPHRFAPPETTADLVNMLSDANGWRRRLAQRLLVEQQSKNAELSLSALLGVGKSDLARLHALWTTEGLGVLTPSHLTVAFGDANPNIRKDAVSLSTRFLKDHPQLFQQLAKLADDEDIRVRFQVALALGETDDVRATELLTKLARRDGGDPWFVNAVLTAASQRSGAIVAGLVSANSGHQPESSHSRLVRELATVVGVRGDASELSELLKTVASAEQTGVWWQTAALSGLATGLPRHNGPLGRTNLPKLLADPPESLAQSVAPIHELLQQTQGVALAGEQNISNRIAAVELLGFQPFDKASPAYESLLAADQPVELQLACVEAMRRSGNDGAAAIVLKHWLTLGPQVRTPALGLLLSRTGTTRLALEAMATGQINPAVIDIDGRVRLLRHGDPAIKALATKLLGGAVSSNRREVAEQYHAALTTKSSAADGLKIFDKICAKCHRIDGRGHEVGPDISDVRNRSREALLYDILDPNRKLEPRFTDYAVVTVDGRVFNGLMVSETAEAIVLRQAEGKQQVIARSEIDELRASGKSLMPEGVEKDVTVQQMADLLEYLKSRATPVN